MLNTITLDDVLPFAAEMHASGLTLSKQLADLWYRDVDGRGLVGVKSTIRTLTVGAIFVHESERRLGYGTAIMEAVISSAGSDRDVEIVALPELHPWLARLGFIAIEKRQGKLWLLRKPALLG